MKTISRSLAIFVMAFMFSLLSLSGIFSGANTQKVQAENEDQLCIPSYTDEDGDSGERWSTDAFEFEFISRTEIQVNYIETGDCVSPSGLSSKYLHNSGIEFASFVEQRLVLTSTVVTSGGSLTPVVLYAADLGGSSDVDESIIHVKDWNTVFGDDTDINKLEFYRYLDAVELSELFANAEYTIGIEEDLLEIATCPGTNSNFHLVDKDDDGDSVKWICDDDSTNEQGANVMGHMSNAGNFNIAFKVDSDGNVINLINSENSELNFTKCANGTYVNDSCNGEYTLNANPRAIDSIASGVSDFEVTGPSNFTIRVAGADNENVNTREEAENGRTGGNGDESNGDTCEDSGWELSWIACPLLFGADKALNWVTEQINHLLQVPDSYIRPSDNPDALRDIWVRFRDIAYMILIPIMLFMVISTALGFEFVSAYTVKKAMPRLFLAVIFIAFSFQITEFLVLITNDIGTGTHGLITGAVQEEEITLASLFSADLGDSIFYGTAGALALAGTVAVAGITVLLSYAFVAVLVLIAGLFMLALRQMLIIGLMIFAPLAILSWIFPGNDKLWKLWWGSFSKLLLMFPLIMALIATGKVFAFIISEVDGAAEGGNGQLLLTGMKLLAFVAPFFFIPATFKFAGGVFGTVTGMVNDKSRGLFDRQKRYRGKKMQQNFQDSQNFNRFKGSNAFSRRANSILGYGANANKAGLRPNRMRSKLSAARSDREILGREAMLNDDDYTWKGNDTLNRAAFESQNESQLRSMLERSGDYANDPVGKANMERDIAKVEGMRRKYGNKAFRQAAFLQAISGGTAFDNEGPASVWKSAASVAGNDDAVLADLVAKGRGAAMNAGRIDQGGAGFGKTMDLAKQFRENQNYNMDLANQRLTSMVYDGQGPNAISHQSMKPKAVENMVPEIRRRLKNARASGDDAFDRELALTASLYDTLSATNPEKAEILGDGVMNWDIGSDVDAPISSARQDGVSQGPYANVQQFIEARRGTDVFRTTRREYQSAQDRLASIAGREPPQPGQGYNNDPNASP